MREEGDTSQGPISATNTLGFLFVTADAEKIVFSVPICQEKEEIRRKVEVGPRPKRIVWGLLMHDSFNFQQNPS